MKKSFIGEITSAKLTLSGDFPLTLVFAVKFKTKELIDPNVDILGVNAEFISRFLAAIGVKSFYELKGKSCRLTQREDSCWIRMIKPLHSNGGELFDIDKWRMKYEREKFGG
ncbi:MAG: hypothetical protein KAS07_01750 [Candidatus Pacebacteria bacterium]|nr:hypothetical protein [Candidatus Paceibacterota bacterium]